MNNWGPVRLEEVCEKITVGHVGSMAEQYVDDGVLFLRSQNIVPFGLDLTPNNVRYIPQAFHEKLKKSSLKPRDVAIVRTGYPGTSCVIPENFGEVNCADLVIIRTGKDLDPHFLCYYLNSPYGKGYIEGGLVGAAQQHFNVGVARRLEIKLPPFPTQRRIAAILSAYDELIENNNRRIRLLEEMARQLYREWFVRLRFPGWREVRVVKGVPVGWAVNRLSEFVRTQYGYTTSAEDAAIGPKFLRITDIVPKNIEWEDVPYCQINDVELEKYLVNDGDIVVARTGATVGYSKLLHNPPEAVFASYLVRMTPKKKEDKFVIGQVVESEDYKKFIQSIATGAAQPQANATLLTMFNVLIPSNEIKEKYNALIIPLFDEKNLLLKKNTLLRQTRDLLLPRLISGQLKV